MSKEFPAATFSDFPEFAVRITQMIATWNGIERGLFFLMNALTGMSPQHADAMLTMTSINSSARLALLMSVGKIELKHSKLSSDFDSLMKAMHTCLKLRNNYAHGVYVLNREKDMCILHHNHLWPPSENGMRVLHDDVLKDELDQFKSTLDKMGNFLQEVWNQMPEEKIEALLKIWSLQDLPHLPSPE